MALDRVERTAEELGYLDAAGYVKGTSLEPGARDFVWRDLRDKCHVDAAYFKGAVPLVAFAGADTPHELAAIHRRLWNFSRVPLLIATTPDGVTAVNCVAPPTSVDSAESAVLSSARANQPLRQVMEAFTRFGVESGRVAALYPQQLDRRQRVNVRLLENLRALRSRLERHGLTARQIERILGRSIFIRYLEDRMILSAEHLVDLGVEGNFVDTLRIGRPAVFRLFEGLAEHFNGDVFSLDDSDTGISDEALFDLAAFFSATDLASGQQALWPYEFGIIPPELISSIYEQLLESSQRQDAAYYTPRHVVDIVLDELMPWGAGDSPTVIDPACGSGIFLTEAFRRLAYRHAAMDSGTASFASLADLLKRSIFGVDKSPAAVGVAAFGLYLALLERVDPPTAWREARLPQLVSENLIASDFFDSHALAERRFDVVVGNPPWKSSLSRAAHRFVRERQIDVPDQQIALAFLWRSAEMVTSRGAVGLVLPAKGLLHNRSQPAVATRRRIFSELAVETVMDLSPLRRETFGAATNPACIIIVRSGEPSPQIPLVHVSPRRTPLASAIDGVVVPQENIRQVPLDLARTSTVVWKTYLWGGPPDLTLVSHLQEGFPSLSSVAKARGWISGQGFQVRGGDLNDASEILGWPVLDTSSVTPLQIERDSLGVVSDPVMHRPRNPRIYRAPHIVMRKGFSDYPASAFVDFDAAFTDGLYGLSGPPADVHELMAVAGLLNSSVARYWFFMTSSSWGVEREQIHPNEFLSLPVPELDGAVGDAIVAAVEMARSGHSGWTRKLDNAVYRAYGLSRAEIELIRDGLGSRLDEYRHGPASTAYKPPSGRDFTSYVRTLAGALRAGSSIDWTVSVVERSLGYAVVLSAAGPLGAARPALSVENLMLTDTTREWESPAAVVQPAVIVLTGAAVHLVKPDERRCWTRSAARADAAEIISAVLRGPTESH